MALGPLHKKYTMKRVVVSTYQSVSGSGIKAVQQLDNEEAGIEGAMAYPHIRLEEMHCRIVMFF